MDKWKRKLGKIRYPKEWIREHPVELMNCLHEFIVLDARFDWPSDSVEALGFHPAFNIVVDGCEAPRYDFVVIRDGDDIRFELYLP